MKTLDKSTHCPWLLPALLCSAALAQQAPDPQEGVAPVPFAGDRIFNDQPPFLAGVTVDRADAMYHEGDRLRVQFTAEHDAFLYLIYHQADRQSRLLFPNESQTDNQMPARQAML